MNKLDDDSKMPIGMHQGKDMSEVPDSWLQWFWNQNKEEYLGDHSNGLTYNIKQIMIYIEENHDVIFN